MLWAGENGVTGVPGPLELPVPADVRFRRPKLDVGAGDLMEEPECRDVLELDGWRAGFALLFLSLREKKPIIGQRSAVRRQRSSNWRGRRNGVGGVGRSDLRFVLCRAETGNSQLTICVANGR
jgi:hypothetical protein